MAATASSSSEISKTEYDVFLSFRGPDTRQGFTDVLYNHLKDSGLRVFRDDDELAIGDTIELIPEAINNSKICVPIFSKSFASSAWCLREIAKMVELNKEIVPIFYDVTSDDVKLKTPLYVDQMKKKHAGKAAQLEEEWEKALMQVGRIKGRALKNKGFIEFSQKFMAEISLKLRVKQQYTIKHLEEMPDEVEETLKLLEMESVDVRFLGLYGMGGIGKTTRAKIIFNRISSSFDSCSFLENIREEHSCKGVEYLRTKILRDLNPKGANDNPNILDNWDSRMERCVRMKSVLIVLDDVGERSHIEELVGNSISFGSRSRIIVTTRDERVLLMTIAETSSSSKKMEVKGMDPEQSMQLFSRYAFGRDCPPDDFTSLSEDVVSLSGGLPLALQVIGSLLYGMSIEAWEDKVKKLKKIPAEDVQKKLMISYNDLEDDVKEIFLDIACFFIGEEQSNPIYMWKSCEYAPTWSIQVLVAMSLVKITDDGKFWVHDQLRDMGREIIRMKENNSPTFREGSRIQTYEDAFSVLKRNKGKEVVGLRLNGISNEEGLTDFADFDFERLRFLQVAEESTFYHRNFWHLCKNLRWLSLRLNKRNMTTPIKSMIVLWMASRNQDNSYLANLAVLDLSGSDDIPDNWKGWILIQELRRLKVLNLSGCKKLTRTPNFSKMEALEKLILCLCVRLVQIDSSIGKLQKLKYLNLQLCYKLMELPEEIGNLEDLEQLIMTCTRVSKLPDSIGKLENLENLDLWRSVELEKLPESIGLLSKLKHLNLWSSHSLHKLPDSIGGLTSLVSLDMEHCGMIVELPRSITRLEKLERLLLGSCGKLVKLPDELGNLKSLVELDLSDTGVVVVPESIGDLTRIQMINLSGAPVKVLPQTVAQLSLLQKLDLSGCHQIERFPVLPTSLTDVNLEVCFFRQAVDLSKLTQLRALTLYDIKLDVESLQQEPYFKSDAMERLLKLELLDVRFTSHTSLPFEFTAFTQLKNLTLDCSKLTRIPPFPLSLQSLALIGLGREMKLPCLSNLNNLSQLEFLSCPMEGLPDLSQLKSLQALELCYCEELVDITGLGTLVSLKDLDITYCDSIKRLKNIKNLTNLRSVTIYGCKNFTGIQDLEDSRLPKIYISGCKCKDYVRR